MGSRPEDAVRAVVHPRRRGAGTGAALRRSVLTAKQNQHEDNRERDREAIRTLLRTRLDYLPTPRVLSFGESGPGPGKRVPCTTCARTGRIRVRREGVVETRYCPVCDGHGWRLFRAAIDAHRWDEYVREEIPDEETATPKVVRAMTLRELDQSIERLEQMAAEREGRIDHERFGWEKARAARDRSGSYPALDTALAELLAVYPDVHRTLRRVYEGGVEPKGRMVVQEAFGVGWLLLRMPRPIRVPAWAMQSEAKRREASVAGLAAQGLSSRKIARRLGMEQGKVKRILKELRGNGGMSPSGGVPTVV